MFEVGDLLSGLELESLGDGRFRAPTMDYYGKSSGGAAASAISDVIAGGQLLGQALVAAAAMQPGKTAKSVHAVFARSGRVSLPLELRVETVQDGRTMGCVVIGFWQQDRIFATATVMLHVPDPDVIRHAALRPVVPDPDGAGTRLVKHGPYEMGFVAGTELSGPDDVGPAEQPLWVRFSVPPVDEATAQALLAFATNFHLVGVAMRPHPGLSQELSHVRVSTGVLSHTVSFHEPFDPDGWLLLDQDVPYAGRGRFFGRGNVFAANGDLVASFVQEGLIRGLAENHGQGGTL
jgi:acyl-CoA thioesterase II